MTPLEAFLEQRNLHGLEARVERVYSWLPRPLARVIEKKITPRHMRAIAPRVFFHCREDRGWTIQRGKEELARTIPLAELVGRLGRPVSIVATGPSVNEYPWERIRKENRFVIAVNGAPTVLKEAGISPDLLVVVDNRFARSGTQHIANAPGVPLVTIFRAASILATSSPGLLAGRRISLLEKINSWYGLPQVAHERIVEMNRQSGSPFHFPDFTDPTYRIGWSEAPEMGFFSASTVVFAALQVAVGLGAVDIEILGMDLSGAGRAYDEGDNPRPSSLQEQYSKSILPSFEIMHQALAGSGVAIRNLSPVCPLPARLFAPQA